MWRIVVVLLLMFGSFEAGRLYFPIPRVPVQMIHVDPPAGVNRQLIVKGSDHGNKRILSGSWASPSLPITAGTVTASGWNLTPLKTADRLDCRDPAQREKLLTTCH